MTLRLLESLSLAAGTPNEDAFAHFDHAALVLDGATPLGNGLMPGPSDAAWIAQFGARRLLAHLKDGDAPRDALERALADTQKSFAALSRHAVQEKWQTPCASMMLAAEEGEETHFLWFGDCAALVQDTHGVQLFGDAKAARAKETARAKLVSLEGKVSPTDRKQYLPLLRAGRNRINTGASWLFSPEPRAAQHASHHAMRLEHGAYLLLASDGFLALATDYGAYDLDGLMAAAKDRGLDGLGEELRAIENADPRAEKFPRFKTSDDATALLFAVD